MVDCAYYDYSAMVLHFTYCKWKYCIPVLSLIYNQHELNLISLQTMTFKRPSGSTTPKDASEFDEIPNLSTGCECKNKCIRTCPCKLKSSLCDGDGCGCNVLICTNRKKDSLPEEDEESVVVVSFSVHQSLLEKKT